MNLCKSEPISPRVLLTVVETKSPSLSLEYAQTKSSPTSSTHIITNDETSIPSTTTKIEFSTQVLQLKPLQEALMFPLW